MYIKQNIKINIGSYDSVIDVILFNEFCVFHFIALAHNMFTLYFVRSSIFSTLYSCEPHNLLIRVVNNIIQ